MYTACTATVFHPFLSFFPALLVGTFPGLDTDASSAASVVRGYGIRVCRDGSEYRWLRDSHFQRDLQRDNIDQRIVHEELQTLHADHTTFTYDISHLFLSV